MFLSDRFNSRLEKIVKIFLPIVFILPFFVQADYYFPFVTPRNFLFRVLISLLLALYVFLVIRNKDKYKPVQNKVLWAYVAFSLVMTVSSLINGDFIYSFWGNYERMEGLLGTYYLIAFFILLLGLYNSKKAWLQLLRFSSFISLIISLIALSQYLGVDLLLASSGGERVSGTLGNPTYLATYGLMHMFILAYLLLKYKHKSLKLELFAFYAIDLVTIYFEVRGQLNSGHGILTVIFKNFILASLFLLPQILLHLNYYLRKAKASLAKYSAIVYFVIAILLNFFAVFNTQTRGALVGLFAGVLASLIFLLFSKQVTRKWKASMGVVMLVGIVLVSSLFIFKDSSLVTGNATLNRVAHMSLTNITVESRLLTWQASWKGFLEKPVLGWGEEKFYVVFNRYFPTDIFQDIGSRVWFDRPHNVFVQHLVHGGILGLAAYLAIFFFAFKNLFKHYKKTKDPKTISIFGGLLVAYMAQNFFVFDSLNSYVPLILILATTIFMANGQKRKTGEEKSKAKNSNANLVTAGVVFLVIVIIGYSINIPQMTANNRFVNTFKAVRASGLEGFDADLNNDLMEVINSSYLGKFEVRQVYSEYAYAIAQDDSLSLYQRGRTIELAEEELLKSLEEQPDNVRHQSFLVNLYLAGSLLDPSYAEKNIPLIENKALKLSPGRTQLYYSLGRSYLTTNNYPSAIAAFNKARELSPGVFESHMNLFSAYLSAGDVENGRAVIDNMLEQDVPVKPADFAHLAEIYSYFELPEDTFHILEVGIDEYPDESKLVAQLAIYYYQQGSIEAYQAYMEKVSQMDPILEAQVRASIGL